MHACIASPALPGTSPYLLFPYRFAPTPVAVIGKAADRNFGKGEQA
jgi:hypothetical protein